MREIFSNLTKTHKALLIICLFTFLGIITLLIKNVAEEAHYETAKLYNTAVHAQTTDSFNYAVDSQQGNVLTSGTFTTPDPVSRPEVKGNYFRISKVEQRYTKHESDYECGTDESPQTCTYTYHTWDYNGEDSNKAEWVNFHSRNYSSELFTVPYSRNLTCDDFIVVCKSGYEYEDNSWWASEGDIRWYYNVTDHTFNGSIFVNTYDGKFEAAEGRVIRIHKQSVPELIAAANNSTSITVMIVMLFVINLIICGILFKENVIEDN